MQAPAINVTGLTKRFDGQEVVSGLNLQIETGQIYGFLGPNGSGKTTTMRMLCGLLSPDAGSGYCLGLDICTQTEQLRKRVGYMTQRFSLYEDLSIRENLDFTARIYGIDQRRQRVNQTLEQLGFSRKRANQLAGQLSGGWKQRLALACSMIHKPRVLLLDEPTAGVDPKARREFWDEIHRLSEEEKVTTLVSTHYMDEAERCERLAFIAWGRIMADGTLESICKETGLRSWEIRGNRVQRLAPELRLLPGIEQVVSFGQTIHVIGTDAGVIEHSLKGYRKEFKLSELPPSAEDLFIYLMSQARDNFS
ncbi:ABC transporter ATP-binding protein [Dongshaea marina]|uniref:ABC transporter ATP-binding protein n=1 Tax=Dongshaea marina TaxID=2047966 RepID=UPI000D3E473A|nr:ABC transporter ATP-binding protein [Dongshaea marina]